MSFVLCFENAGPRVEREAFHHISSTCLGAPVFFSEASRALAQSSTQSGPRIPAGSKKKTEVLLVQWSADVGRVSSQEVHTFALKFHKKRCAKTRISLKERR